MTWTAVPNPLNNARQGLALVTAPSTPPSPGNSLYAIGGDGIAGNPVGPVEALVGGAWAVVTNLPVPRAQLAAATVNGSIHVIGGAAPAPVQRHDVYTPATGWVAATQLPPPARSLHAAVAGPDGRIYVIGGRDATGTYLRNLDIYDPTTNSWVAGGGPLMPTARGGFGACLIGPYIYAIGGENSPAGGVVQALQSVDVYDTVHGRWNMAPAPIPPSLPQPTTQLAAAAGPGGKIYAMGGIDSTNATVRTVYSWDLSSGSWTQLAAADRLPVGVSQLAAATGPDGHLYAVGGVNGGAPSAQAEWLNLGIAAPDPYIGNGGYQSPDVRLFNVNPNGSNGSEIPLGGPTQAAWDTLLLPNTPYNIVAEIHNDQATAAPDTVVRFWHFPGGVAANGVLIDTQYATIQPGPTPTAVQSAAPFVSPAVGQHDCVVVSVNNYQAPYFNVDPTSAIDVVSPTLAEPGAPTHFGSAWRNTDSVSVLPRAPWHLWFFAAPRALEPVDVRIHVATAKVPVDFEQNPRVAWLARTLAFVGAQPRVPLFLVPDIREELRPAPELDVRIGFPEDEELHHLKEDSHHELEASRHRPVRFVVTGRVPADATPGEAYLVEVSAHYPDSPGHPAETVRYLEVIYVKAGEPAPEDEDRDEESHHRWPFHRRHFAGEV